MTTAVNPPAPDTVAGAPASPSWVLAVEMGGIVALLIADWAGLVPLSRTPFLLLLCWLSLRLRRAPWRSIGFYQPQRLGLAIGAGAVAGIIMELLGIFVTVPAIAGITGAPPDMSEWRGVVGNLPALVILVSLSWVLAAFGEEIAFRGYLMTRIGDVLGGRWISWAISLVVASVVFGIGHGTQGVTGIIQESLAGLLLGLLFLAAGRNLTVPIVAHGVANTLAFVLIFFGRYPGL